MPAARKPVAPPLQRGLACLSCRRRKLKCDGRRPACSSCTRMSREDECRYEDKKQKNRTEKLREKLVTLETRLRELEGPAGGQATASAYGPSSSSTPATILTPPIQLQIDDTTSQLLHPLNLDRLDLSSLSEGSISRPVSVAGWLSGSGSSLASSPSLSVSLAPESRSVTGSPFQNDDLQLDQLLGIGATDFTGIDNSVSNPFEGSIYVDSSLFDSPHWVPSGPPPENIRLNLLGIFYAHRHQCWFDGDFSRFDPTRSINQYPSCTYSEPHPALMNSIYLLACHFARSESLLRSDEMENGFFKRTLQEITTALDQSDRLVDVVRASCLLSVYLFANGRILEGYCHSFSAARLAVALGLHRLPSLRDFQSVRAQDAGQSTTLHTPLPPPANTAELRDRISAFWQVFMVDRCWSVANGLPVALPDGEHSEGRIRTPWPEAQEGSLTRGGNPVSSSVFVPALKAKTAALYERTFRLASSPTKGDAYWADHNTTVQILQRFMTSLPFFVGYESWRNQAPFLDVDLFAVHTLVNVCKVHVYSDGQSIGVGAAAGTDMSNVLQAANFIMSLIRQLSPGDYGYLDPLMSACWLSVAKLYLRMLTSANLGGLGFANSNSLSAYAIEGELEVILGAMRALSVYVPLAADHARVMEQEWGLVNGGV
ncbi:hypothetical protein PM082_008908 [Marasmius tenuissimus]|nr:hypothetical protein PM082_008908 [Marasmius tenuissimus]